MSDSRRKKDRYRQSKEERKAEANAEQSARAKNLPPKKDPDQELKALTAMSKRRWPESVSARERELCFQKMEEINNNQERKLTMSEENKTNVQVAENATPAEAKAEAKPVETPKKEINTKGDAWYVNPSDACHALVEEYLFLYSKVATCSSDVTKEKERLITTEMPKYKSENEFTARLAIESTKITNIINAQNAQKGSKMDTNNVNAAQNVNTQAQQAAPAQVVNNAVPMTAAQTAAPAAVEERKSFHELTTLEWIVIGGLAVGMIAGVTIAIIEAKKLADLRAGNLD